MRSATQTRFLVGLLLGCGVGSGTLRALVTLNDGTDKIYVTGTFSMAFDSNISASAQNMSDTTYSAGFQIEYQRRAGMIGVNANINLGSITYAKNRTYNSLNPTYSLELDKNTGRTTGVLNLSAARTSQADAAANTLDQSWAYNVGLNLHYPVIERYSLTGSLGYGYIDYSKTANQPLVNLSSYTGTLGLFYILSEMRDVFVNYRWRYEEASANTGTTDDALMFGVSGKIIWEINGSVSLGYQTRTPHGIETGTTVPAESESDWTASASATWTANRKLTFTGSLSRDFSTTSLDATTDTTAASLDATYAVNARLSAGTGVGGGESRFLGPLGLIPSTDIQRRDYYFTWNASVSYSLNQHLHATLTYGFFKNWSNLGLATFDRNSLTLMLSSRW